jgi:para-nitrobenzyl esterase
VGKRLPQGAMTLLPVGDGEFLPDGPFDAIAGGAARGVDVLCGATADEWNYFLFFVEPNKRTVDDAGLKKIFDKRMNGRGQAAIDLYRSALDGPGAPLPAWRIYCAIESDRMFRIPALRLAEACSAHHAGTFMYHFDWKSPLLDGDMGACHAIEIPFVFGTVDGTFGKAFTGGSAAAQVLSDRTLQAWTSFARTGNPSCELLPEWRPYEVGKRETMFLAPRCELVPAPFETVRGFWDPLQ